MVSLWQYSALQSDVVVLKARYEERIRDLEKDQDGSSPADFTEEVSLTTQYFTLLSKPILFALNFCSSSRDKKEKHYFLHRSAMFLVAGSIEEEGM